MELTSEDGGTQHTVRVGDTITVRLPEKPTTGFRWRPDLESDALRLVEDHSETVDMPRGADAIRMFVFEVVGAGVASLRLVKERSWENRPVDEFGVTLDVLPD